MLSNKIPVPSATQVNGDSAINIGTFNSCLNNSTNPLTNDPPPVRTIPFSAISADNSGFVSSKTRVVSFISLFILSFNASDNSS